MGNGEYLMYAHPAGTNSVNTSDVGGMSAGAAKGRWERIWYLDFTHVGGSNETFNLTFDFSDGSMGGSPAGASTNYKLLYRAGTSGNWTEVMNASGTAGDQVSFNGLAWNTQGDGYYTIGSLNTGVSPLPITLVSFAAEVCDEKVCVNWKTASEKNILGFIVERSSNGIDWEQLETVDGRGNEDQLTTYEVIDNNPLTGYSYYRLNTIEKDNRIVTEGISSVLFHHSDFNAYPNPASDYLVVSAKSIERSNAEFELTEIGTGKTFIIKPARSLEAELYFDLVGVPRGMYVLSMKEQGYMVSNKKLVIK
jgi:hypothetical protein